MRAPRLPGMHGTSRETDLALFYLCEESRAFLDGRILRAVWNGIQFSNPGASMSPYRCDWCNASTERGEKMVCLSRHTVLRRPHGWELGENVFAHHGSEAMFHEQCFVANCRQILDELYSGIPTESPRRRPAEITR